MIITKKFHLNLGNNEIISLTIEQKQMGNNCVVFAVKLIIHIIIRLMPSLNY